MGSLVREGLRATCVQMRSGGHSDSEKRECTDGFLVVDCDGGDGDEGMGQAGTVEAVVG